MRRKKAKHKVQKSMPVAHVGACYRLHTTEHGDQSIVFKQRQAENKPHGVRGQPRFVSEVGGILFFTVMTQH